MRPPAPRAVLILVLSSLLCALLGPVASVADEPNELRMPLVTPEEKRAARERSRGNDGIIEFDLRAQLERRLEAPPMPFEPVQSTPGGDGAWFAPEIAEALDKDFGSHYLITDPTTGIYPRHVRLRMNFTKADGDSSIGSCSGTLISPRHVITAGHCIYTFQAALDGQSRGPAAAKVYVYPGFNTVQGPAGQAFVTSVRTWTGWTQDADYDHDIALLTLNRPVGALVGWRGVSASDNWDHFDESSWDMYAYPGMNLAGTINLGANRMYHQAGNYDYDDYPQVGSDKESYRGTSGGGAIKNGAVWAVRSHFETPWEGDIDTYDTAIEPSKLNTIVSWIDQDLPDASDIQPLQMQAGAVTGEAGGSLTNLKFLVHNQGQSTHTSGVLYTVYIGTESITNINADTYVIDGYSPGSIAAGGNLLVTIPSVVIPPQLATGNYFLGVFLTTVDANYGNNMTRTQDTWPFSVICPSEAVPQPVFPLDDHPCVPVNITLNWGSVGGVGVQYEVKLGKPNEGWAFVTTTSATQHTFYGLDEKSPYNWQVRALTQCGGASAWSTTFSFVTEGPMELVVPLAPSSGEACVDDGVQLQWNPIVNAELYRVRLENVTHPDVQIIDSATASTNLTGLIPGDRYEWQVKARDACLAWGSYGEIWSFYTKDVPAADAQPAAPINSAFTSVDPLLVCAEAPGALDYHFELKAEEDPQLIASYAGEWNWQLSGLVEGPYEWRARAWSCTVNGEVFGAWSGWEGFRVDATPPVFGAPPTAISPPVGVWSSNTLVSVQWTDASDNYAGMGEYWVAFDQSPDTVPDGTNSTPTASSWEFEAQDGQNWFHIVAVDLVGNVSAAQHLGPFLIDTGPPSDPVLSANLEPLTPTHVDDIVVSWPASVDPGSGVAGYSFVWTTAVGEMPDATVDTTELTAALVAVPEGNRWFRIQAIDNLGNAGAVVEARYFIDRSPPTFNWDPQMQPTGPYWNGQLIIIDFNCMDNFGPVRVHTRHYYSVDGGAFWYDALCADPSLNHCGAMTSGSGGQLALEENRGGFQGPFYWEAPWAPPASQVLYKVVAVDEAGNELEWVTPTAFTIDSSTGVGPLPSVKEVTLLHNVPNPFNPQTTIGYALPAAAQVELSIFDLAGRRVRRLLSERQPGPAYYEVEWDGIDGQGRRVSSGVYLYQLRAGDVVRTKRMTLVK